MIPYPAPSLPLSIRTGSTWRWEPLKPDAACTVRVTWSSWNGEEWWITAEALDGPDAGKTGSNTLDRWIEAAVLIEPGPNA